MKKIYNKYFPAICIIFAVIGGAMSYKEGVVAAISGALSAVAIVGTIIILSLSGGKKILHFKNAPNKFVYVDEPYQKKATVVLICLIGPLISIMHHFSLI